MDDTNACCCAAIEYSLEIIILVHCYMVLGCSECLLKGVVGE